MKTRTERVTREFIRFVAFVAGVLLLAVLVLWQTLSGWSRSEFLSLAQILVEAAIGLVALRALWIAYQEFDRASRRPDLQIEIRNTEVGLQFPAPIREEEYEQYGLQPGVPAHRWLFGVYASNRGEGVGRHVLVDLTVYPSVQLQRPGVAGYGKWRVEPSADTEFPTLWHQLGSGDPRFRLQFVGGLDFICFDGQEGQRIGRIQMITEGDCLLNKVVLLVTGRAEGMPESFGREFEFDELVSRDPWGQEIPEDKWRWRFVRPPA